MARLGSVTEKQDVDQVMHRWARRYQLRSALAERYAYGDIDSLKLAVAWQRLWHALRPSALGIVRWEIRAIRRVTGWLR